MTELDRPSEIVPDNTHEQLGVLEQRNKLLAWTKNTPELFVMFGEAKGKRYKKREILNPEVQISKILESSMTKSVDQFRLGLDMGYYHTYPGMPIDLMKRYISKDAETLFKVLEGIDYYTDASLILMATSVDEVPEADEFAWQYWKKFTTFPSRNGNDKPSQPLGYLTAEERQGIPIIYCDKRKDLESFIPVNVIDMKWPDDIQAFSFMVTENTTPYVGSNEESRKMKDSIIGSLWVVAMDDCPANVVDQHIVSHLSFASSVDKTKATPVYVSREELVHKIDNKEVSVAEALDIIVKDVTLEYLVTDKVPHTNMWDGGHKNRKSREYNTGKTLFLNRDRGDLRKLVKPGEKEKVEKDFGERLSNAFDIVQRLVVTRFPDNKLGHLIVANTLAHYPLKDWDEVASLLSKKTLKNPGLRQLGVLKR